VAPVSLTSTFRRNISEFSRIIPYLRKVRRPAGRQSG